MSSAWRSSQFDSQEAEPLGPLANLIDIMLVFACGLIAALVAVSPDLEQHFNITPENTKANMQVIDALGKELPTAPEAISEKMQSAQGYQAMGQVYKDPKTGKLILISNEQ